MTPPSGDCTAKLRAFVRELKDPLKNQLAALSRMRVFEPSRCPVQQIRTFEIKPYGRVTIDGRLGVQHQLLLESCLYFAQKAGPNGTNFRLLVDLNDLRWALGANETRVGESYVMQLFVDLKKAAVTIESWKPREWKITGLVVDAEKSARSFAATTAPITGARRRLLVVDLHGTYAQALLEDIAFRRRPELFARIRSAAAVACARWCLTHKHEPNGGWKMDRVLDAVGVNIANQTKRLNERRNLRNSAAVMAAAGVYVENGRLFLNDPRKPEACVAVASEGAHAA